MRRPCRALALASALCLCPFVALADDPYADFRVPEHRTASWLVQSIGSTNADQRNSMFGIDRDRFTFGRFQSRTDWSLESEAQLRALEFAADANWNYYHSRFESAPLTDQSAHQRNNHQVATVSGLQRSYLGGSEYALDVSVVADIELSQSDYSQDGHEISGPSETFFGNESRTRFYQHVGQVTLGIGRGRVRDVTGVFSAQLIEQRLLATGGLSQPLSAAARLRIAQLHYLANDYSSAHDRPARYFWREVERVLREDGALRDSSLDAYSLVRVLEPAMGGAFFLRRSGTFVRPFFFGSEIRGHEDFDTRSSYLSLFNGSPVYGQVFESSNRNHLDREDSGAGVGVEYHRPVGMRWQSDLSTAASYGGGPRRSLDLGSAAQIQYMIADRWYSSASLQYDVLSERLDDVRSEPTWFLQGRAQLSYLVEDSWSFDLQFSTSQAQSRNQLVGFFGAPESIFQRFSTLLVGLTYRPFGRFDAPGLGVAERLSTPRL